MEQLIYEIAGVKYLLIERQMTDANKSKLESAAKQHNCIWQGVKELKQNGFLSHGYAIIKLLVPDNEVIAFNAAKY